MLTKGEKMGKLKVGEIGHLVDLQKGQVAKVLGLHNDNPSVKRRLLDMGITTGVEVKVKKFAPLGDPVCIEVRGYELCLRKCELSCIEVNKL